MSPTGKRVIKVSPDQVSAARALINLRGGPDKVDPVIARIAEARPGTASEPDAQAAS